MITALDSSILVAAICENDRLHSECAAILDQGHLQIHIHALSETFSTLTGGQIVPRVTAKVAAQIIESSILPNVTICNLTVKETLSAMREAEARGIRGGAIYDYLHLSAARKAKAKRFYTLNFRHFQSFHRLGDPEIIHP
jgi:predicted nucleic acid-binding protein